MKRKERMLLTGKLTFSVSELSKPPIKKLCLRFFAFGTSGLLLKVFIFKYLLNARKLIDNILTRNCIKSEYNIKRIK